MPASLSPSTEQLSPSTQQRSLYDERYADGYMRDFGHLYEHTRMLVLRGVLRDLAASGVGPRTTLDYGCGGGRWFVLIRQAFPSTELIGADISRVALEHARSLHPAARLLEMGDEVIPLDENSVDLVVSVEVLEHVEDVARATREIARVLRPGGVAVISTPCANRWSLEWIVNRVTSGLLPSADGYGRFATDEPGHLRRLDDTSMRTLLRDADLHEVRMYHAAHVFTSLAVAPERIRGYQRIPMRLRAGFAMLDWRLFKNRANGATMIVVATKPPVRMTRKSGHGF
jgi:SAM-dependent methyltransferase